MNRFLYTYKSEDLIISFIIKAFIKLLSWYEKNMFLYLGIKTVNLDLKGGTIYEWTPLQKKIINLFLQIKAEKN